MKRSTLGAIIFVGVAAVPTALWMRGNYLRATAAADADERRACAEAAKRAHEVRQALAVLPPGPDADGFKLELIRWSAAEAGCLRRFGATTP